MSAGPLDRMRRHRAAIFAPVRPVPFGQPCRSAFEITLPGVPEPFRDATSNQMPQAAAVSESTA